LFKKLAKWCHTKIFPVCSITTQKEMEILKSPAPNNKQLLCDPFEILNIGIWILLVIWNLNIVI